jgi:hypothetical protein
MRGTVQTAATGDSEGVIPEWNKLKFSGEFSRHNLTVAEAHRYGLRFD